MRKFLLSTLLTALLLGSTPAQLLAVARVISNVKVTDGGRKQYFNLFQSQVEKSLWYCGQTKPALLTRLDGNLEIPEISVIRFQKKNLKNSQEFDEGAYFRMHLSLGPSDDVLEQLKKRIPDAGSGKPVVLSPVPFGAIRLYLQRPDGKQVLLHPEALTGISSRHSSQYVAFSTVLGKLDADLLDALLRGNTGAKYLLQYNYSYNDPVVSRKPAGSLPVGGRDLSGTASGDASAGRNLPGSRDLAAIQNEAAAESGWEKAGEGFIGLGRFDRAVQDRCIFVEDRSDQWENAYLTLPVINMPAGIDVSRVELDVSLMYADKAFSEQRFTWTPDKKWRDRHGAPLVYGLFDLAEIRKKNPADLNSVWFSIKQQIESAGGDVLKSENRCEMVEGDSPISDPLQLADVLEFEMGLLNWAAAKNDGLKRIEIELNDGDWKSSRTIEPRAENGRIVAPDAARWLVRRGVDSSENAKAAGQLTATVNFIVADGRNEKKVQWYLNGADLRALLPALSAVLFDKDWSGK